MLRPACLALAALASACGPAVPEAGVACRDLDAGYETRYAGDDALARCVHDPHMQQEGHRREAVLDPGRFDFGDGRRLELGSHWTIRGAGVERTRLYPSRPTTAVFRDDIHSALFVRGAQVHLSGFTFDGSCSAGPSPGPGCAPNGRATLLALVVACGYGMERGPDCDVDGLVVEDVRVEGVKTPFVATSSEPHPEAGEKGLFANFEDLHWTIRRFQVASPEASFRYARIFELGNAAAAESSQGPGVGVAAPRRYRVDIEDTDIDAHVGKGGGQLAGVLTMAVNAPVSLEVRLVRSRLVGTERVVGIAADVAPGAGHDGGSARFVCEGSQLVADQRDWAGRVREPGSAPCPPFDAAVYVGEFAKPGSRPDVRAVFRGCEVRVEGWIALCPAPASIDLGPPGASTCLEDTPATPAARGAGALESGPCVIP